MRLCWNETYGPIPLNAEARKWDIVNASNGLPFGIPRVFFADDATGEVWAFARVKKIVRDGAVFVFQPDGIPDIKKYRLGTNVIRIVPGTGRS